MLQLFDKQCNVIIGKGWEKYTVANHHEYNETIQELLFMSSKKNKQNEICQCMVGVQFICFYFNDEL